VHCGSITYGSVAYGYVAYRSMTWAGCGSVALLTEGFWSVFWFIGVLRSVTWVLGVLWPARLIPKSLGFVGQI